MDREELLNGRLTKKYGVPTIRCDYCGDIVHLEDGCSECRRCGRVYNSNGNKVADATHYSVGAIDFTDF